MATAGIMVAESLRGIQSQSPMSVRPTTPLFRRVETTASSPNNCKKDAIRWTVPKRYRPPRKVVVDALETLDKHHLPDLPGMLYESTLMAMVRRFDKIFYSISDQQLADVLEYLRRHTRIRRGTSVVRDGIVEWEHTTRIYELFTLELNMCERIFFTVDVGSNQSRLSMICSQFLVFLIFLSITAWVASTHPSVRCAPADCTDMRPGSCEPEPLTIFRTIEQVCAYVFTLEYFIRLVTVHRVRFAVLDEVFVTAVLTGYCSTLDVSPFNLWIAYNTRSEDSMRVKLDGMIASTVKHVLGPANVVDLLAILPYWIETLRGTSGGGGGMLMVLRVLRLTRVFRVFKLGKCTEVFTVFSRVVTQAMPALILMLFFIALGSCLFGTLVFFAEQGTWYPQGHASLSELNITGHGAYLRHVGPWVEADQLQESPFESIPHSFWFIIVTISTVGYGDVCPTTAVGKLVGSLLILHGVIVLAMPIGVVGATFSSQYCHLSEDRQLRLHLKWKFDTLTAAAEEHDAALEVGGMNLGLGIDGARQRILVDAEKLESRWQSVFPASTHYRLSSSLRLFIHGFLCSYRPATNDFVDRGAKPVISIAWLAELDMLSKHVKTAIEDETSFQHFADFGLRDAQHSRLQWSKFVDRCWEYIVDMCHVEAPAEPVDFSQMRANLARSSHGKVPCQSGTGATASRDLTPDQDLSATGWAAGQNEDAPGETVELKTLVPEVTGPSRPCFDRCEET